jgi:hypothetical protein
MPRIIGDDLLARDSAGRLRTRIATVFPRGDAIVTLPGIHATQRVAYVEAVNQQRCGQSLAPLSDDEFEDACLCAVDLVLEDDTVLIRPDPADMPLAFEADELLQQIVPKRQIKFLHVLDPRVRDAIKRRGECWRINALPRSPEQMREMIAASRIAIGGRDIYYYNNTSGTRLLTCQEFCGLSNLPLPELRKHLEEIRDYASRTNRLGRPEVTFFMAGPEPLREALGAFDFAGLDEQQLRTVHETLCRTFHDAVRPEFRRDDPTCPPWRSGMYAALIGQTDKSISEESLLGLSAEFFMQVEWLPGARIEDGELLFDSVFDEDPSFCSNGNGALCDEKARGFIINFIRDYGDLEHVNIGRVAGSLSARGEWPGRRGVYLAEIKQRGNIHPILRIIRMQKWGVREHLDEGKELLGSILQSEQYTEYILDRRLGCRQLGMNLPPRVAARKVGEPYAGNSVPHRGMTIWSAYFERDYVAGLATDKVAAGRFADARFSEAFARMLGRAAAPNLIVGRCDLQGNVVFDDGDELVIEDTAGMPVDIIVADPTGTFTDYRRDLRDLAPAYAGAVNRRAAHLADPRAFGATFGAAFVERFEQIQRDYRKRRRAFDTLFKHLQRDEGGSFAFRWERVLHRLRTADAHQLWDRIRQHLQSP